MMSQMFHVVKCFRCDCFQVQQVKKVKRWTCKVCGEKQSLLKEFAGGSGADCGRHVRRLNAGRGAASEEAAARSLRKRQEEQTGSGHRRHQQQVFPTQVSRWSKYVDPPEDEDNQDILKDVWCFQSNSMTDRKRKRDADGRHRSNVDTPDVRRRPPPSSGPDVADTPGPEIAVTWPRPLLPASSSASDRGPAAAFVTADGGPRRTAAAHPPVTWPRPLLPASSMFDSGEDFDVAF
ncbi:MRN complex-interacting protein isoform X2 [Phycodurus eques]|uniref:MRN complex-interacting protein isoform X2 n=1 Tax=Phycodurus eques TaxID=693459 RepID=UPI002ACDB21A|nr:MRN complex-interacting protein isoform X2 [Phycodurus eques]